MWLRQGRDFFQWERLGSILFLCPSEQSRGQAQNWLQQNSIPELTRGRWEGHMLSITEKIDFMEGKNPSPVASTPEASKVLLLH